MTDFYGREIQIGDICVRSSGYSNHLESLVVAEISERGVVLKNSSSGRIGRPMNGLYLVDITAIEREVREQQFLNSVKALDVKPNDTVVASMIPNQITFTETKRMYDALKVMFPDNPVSMVLGIDVSIEKYTES